MGDDLARRILEGVDATPNLVLDSSGKRWEAMKSSSLSRDNQPQMGSRE